MTQITGGKAVFFLGENTSRLGVHNIGSQLCSDSFKRIADPHVKMLSHGLVEYCILYLSVVPFYHCFFLNSIQLLQRTVVSCCYGHSLTIESSGSHQKERKLTPDLESTADSLQIERLLLHEVGVAALCQVTGPELLEKRGRVENLLR